MQVNVLPEEHEDGKPTWANSAGIFKDDPLFEEFQQEIQYYRGELDALSSQMVDVDFLAE